MKTYAITKGGIARIMRCQDWTSADEQIAQWHPDDQAQVSAIRQIEDADVPETAEYKDAWVDTGTAIVHDMPKARDIHREKLRILRQPLLDALDIEYLRADAKGGDKAAIEAKRQALRDIPQHPGIDAATTVEELSLITIGA